MNEYYVTMEAVYLHAVFGPFTLEEAIAKANEFANDPDEDGHHEYRVRKMPVATGMGHYHEARGSRGSGKGYWQNDGADALKRACRDEVVR